MELQHARALQPRGISADSETVVKPPVASDKALRHSGSPPDERAPRGPDQDPEMPDDDMQDDQTEDVNMGFIGSPTPEIEDTASQMRPQAVVSSGRGYARETRAACRRIVSEVYSPPRVTAELRRQRRPHLVPGFAFDLTTLDPDDNQPWDFTIPAKREKARRMLAAQKPYLLIGSPMCTAFSTWQYLNESKSSDVAAVHAARQEAVQHVEFMMSVVQMQLHDNRYFLYEHPAHATSWQLDVVKELLAAPTLCASRLIGASLAPRFNAERDEDNR